MKDKSQIIKRLGKGIFLRDFSGRLCYEVHEVRAEQYWAIRRIISAKFNLLSFGFTISTPDEIFKTYIKGFRRIGIEWDWSSGLIVVAKNQKAELLVEQIGLYFESLAALDLDES